ncbi:Methyltransferase-like protein 22 isoform X2 [Oopsacas minuta]|uniref:Methyltransferase-like protein 22 isoform X2 n=1 Tax=Oopsacas minuta TaxID=111878 RepID=A0AAV7KIU5_9METZ|nr:Methyltransferase-like protein 22 isoform X2 [Oopsacas minuta]
MAKEDISSASSIDTASGNDSCVFCRILHGTSPGEILFSDEEVFCIRDIRPASTYHILVIPKQHLPDSSRLRRDQLPLLTRMEQSGLQTVQQLGGSVEEDEVIMGFHWPPFCTQSHLHLHVISPKRQMSDEVICSSEVHTVPEEYDTNNLNKTRFLLNLSCLENQYSNHKNSCIDKDGDLDVSRRDIRYNLAVTICHSNSSPLSLAGLQVWNGSIIMCDYLLSNPISIQEHVVLELGSGTGLTSVTAAHLASVVFATDNSAPVLCLLDWKRGICPPLEDQSPLKEFVFNASQIELLAKSDVILACDTIYDTEGVEDFIYCIYKLISDTLMSRNVKLYLSLEKRINFSISTLSACSGPYDVLFLRLEELRNKLSQVIITWDRIKLEHIQNIEYERNEYLQLWIISFEKID